MRLIPAGPIAGSCIQQPSGAAVAPPMPYSASASTMTSQAVPPPEAHEIERESAWMRELEASLSEVIVGQRGLIRGLLIGLVSGGHVLLEGVPGLAKSLAVSGVAQAVHGDFARLQFTPDLLPSDLIGTEVYNAKEGTFSVRKGPIFANFVLADEINRAPAKVQSALLEAMQERQVTIGDETHVLDEPFLVVATQNPIEHEGTYPLPEAQVDRFMLKVEVAYPSREEERQIMDMMTGTPPRLPKPVVQPDQLLHAREVVQQVYLDDRIKQYVVDLVFATREPESVGAGQLKDFIEYGASPRASIFLVKAARAHAFLQRRGFVTPDDVRAMGMDVLRHRVIVTYEAEAEEVTPEDVVRRILDRVEVP